MTEEVLQKLPDVSEFPTSFTIKSTEEVLKQAIIDANPGFASLNWDDFEFGNTYLSRLDLWDDNTLQRKEDFVKSFQLRLKNNPDRIRYYRNRTPYQFNYKPVDISPLIKSLFGPLVNKSFKFDLKDELDSLLRSIPYKNFAGDSLFQKVKVSDNEMIYFFAIKEVTDSSFTRIFFPDIFYNGADYLSIQSNSELAKTNIEYLKQHIPYIRFVAEAISEEDMISTPDQPTQPNLTINPSNVYTVS